MSLLLLGANQFNVKQDLFSSNEQGLWLDPSDMTAGKAGWRRNLLTYSDQYSNAVWGKEAVSVTANSTVAPDGTTTADTITEDGTTARHRLSFNFSHSAGVAYTYSVEAKLGTGTRFLIINANTAFAAMAAFNLSLGTVHSTTSGSAAITSLGDGWYRCSVTGTATTTSTSVTYIQLDNDGVDGTYLGDSSSSLILGGSQVEIGSTPTEYQPITDFSTEFKAAFPTHTLYQDSNGVTPCTAAGDPVGLIIDQSRGGLGALGSELVTNGDFSDGTTGWSVWNANAQMSVSNGQMTIAQPVGGNQVGVGPSVGYTTVVGRTYIVSLDLISISNGGFGPQLRIGSFNGSVDNTSFFLNSGLGRQSGVFRANATTTFVNVATQSTAGNTVTFDNISVREVPGNHAYQTTSASRPTLARIPSSGRRNVLVRSEEFDNASWLKQEASISQNTAAAPDGTTTADTLIASTNSSNVHRTTQASITVVNGQQYTLSVYAKSDGTYKALRLGIDSPLTTPNFDLENGIASSGTITSVGNGWYRCSVTFTANATTATIRFSVWDTYAKAVADTAYTGTGTNGIFIWGAQLETGSTATNYQKVVATTDVTESGVSDLWHLVFDGSDDSLTTNSVDMTGTAQMTVIAGVRKLSDAADAIVVEYSATVTTSNGTFGLYAPGGNAPLAGKYAMLSRGTSTAISESAGYAAPSTNVISAAGDISSDTAILRANGSQIATSSSDQGNGNYGNHIIFIGRRNQTSSPFTGHIYQLIIRGKTTPTGKLLEAERFVGKKTGLNL